MVIERRLGTENNPDVLETGSEVEVFVEPTEQDKIKNAAQILITEQDFLMDDEIDAQIEPAPIDFNANLALD